MRLIADTLASDISEEKWAYLAGLIDGEGHIGISKHARPRYRYFYFQLKVAIVQKDDDIPNWLKNTFGGYIRVITKRENVYYEWSIGGKRAAWLLSETKKYMRGKKPQAEIAIKFQNGRKLSSHYKKGEAQQQEILYNKLRKMHLSKGPSCSAGQKERVTPVEPQSEVVEAGTSPHALEARVM